MPQFNGDVIFLDGSGQVRATNGSLTLRGDDTGTKAVIIGSGMALRPETDVRIDLGRPDLRWHRMHAGYIESRSGVLGDNQPAGSKLTFNENSFTWDTANVEFVSSTIDFTNAQLVLDSASQLISNGFLDVLGTFRVRTDINAVDGDVVHRIGSPTSRFGYVYAGSGIFNALRPYTSGTFINVEGSLLPSRDALYSLGTNSSRWGTAHVASGIFNTIGASVSGTRIESAASFIPNRHNIYSLGTTQQRWAILYVTSGMIPTISSTTIVASDITADTVAATTGSFNDVIINRSLTLNADGFSIVSVGATTWDLNGAQLDIINGTVNLSAATVASNGLSVSAGLFTDTLDVSSTATITGTLTTRNVVPQTDRLYALGTNALRYSRMHAASGVFNTLSPQSSGTYITSVGSIVPERTALYSLGTSSLRWGNIFATSGDITTLTASSASFTSAATATTFAKRPTLNGSGIALADENYFEAYGGRALDLGSAVTNVLYQVDASAGSIANFDDHFINCRASKLVNYAVNTQHLNGSQPNGWFIRMRLNEDTHFWASGAIYFHPTALTNGRIVGQWQGNTHIPSGSRVRLSIDNNGGASVNIVISKVWVGLSVSGTI